jgi:transcriptional regulator with XRE-family HTH domain
MPTTPLSSALKSKQKAGKLSVTALAKSIGVTVQSVAGVLKGRSVPNLTTAPKYAKFLGLTAADFSALAKPVAAQARSVGRRRQRRVARRAAPAPRTPRGVSITLAEAVALSSDALAVAVHRASEAQRRILTSILAELP